MLTGPINPGSEGESLFL